MDKIHPAKKAVASYWSARTCGTQFAQSEKFSSDYFSEIEKARYRLEPYIHTFAEFKSYHGKKILEVGLGAGTDFVQWVRAGAFAYGVDLTSEAIEHTRCRLDLEGLEAVDLRQADAERLDYPDNSFDLTYCWGVIHHTPDPYRALQELVRVTKPKGELKLMIYHRHSVAALMTWLRRCLLRGQVWRPVSYAIANYMESPGTRAFTRSEARAILESLALERVDIRTVLTWCDLAANSHSTLYRGLLRILATLGGKDRVGWFMLIKARK